MKTAAVIVTYRPDEAVFFRLLERLHDQVQLVCIVDNGSDSRFLTALSARLAGHEHLLPLGANLGIAEAQNRGIALAKQLGATHVILFDHDSSPALDMVSRLSGELFRLEAKGFRVASIGPRYLDERQDNPPPFIRVKGLRLTRCLVAEDGDSVEVNYLIASGCLIPVDVLNEVGGMNSDLFIDYVDIEWGQRARAKGYRNFGCFSALMQHSLGDEPIFFLKEAYPVRSPLRHYYMFRNAVLLYRMRHIPFDWKLADGFRLWLKFVFYCLFASPRRQHFWMMTKGLVHGCSGRTGKL
jgi:rhamnosyltransferase